VRVFVAVWPPADVVAGLAALPRPAVAGVRWTTPDQWHLTVRFLGPLPGPEDVVTALRAAPLPATTVAVGPASECLGTSVLVLPGVGLGPLAEAVLDVTAGFGEPPDRRPFRGHLTLARARRATERGVLSRIPSLQLDAAWPVAEVTVVSSTVGGTGSRYEIVARIPVDPG